ncbi:bifunctional lysylphosphatidylglycerol flippase/synthetase MprF [Cellulomonas humilata]|uniref:Lysyl-tRNA synthetase class 2 n=1 Tax=Cellulomonas humilata TaxID=144055 RepID=A0ABU0EIP3_9CELL|nr:phosphatidylglycerol lysyltransferase domain-containing protein [Cellulomonas humilata]MDQ0375151.1 lysyl-tRNA synthetase class 2 [Cellulomonas humilata]
MTGSSVRLPRTTGASAIEEQRRRGRVREIASRATLILAVLSLLSATIHPLWQRMGLVRDVVPELVVHTARPSLALVSVVLLLTARGLRRGNRLAWLGTLVVLAFSVVIHLAKGPDVLPALVIAVGIVWLAAQGNAFPVLPTRRAVRWAIIWTVAAVVFVVVLVVGLAVWAVATDATDAEIERLGRILVPVTYALTLVFVAALLWSLLSPRRPRRLSPEDHRDERERARLVVQKHGSGTLDYFALRDDKDWFFTGSTVVAHSARGGVCLVSPDPIGPPDERGLAWAEFLDFADDFGWSVAVIGAAADWLPVYESSGLRTVYLGDEAIVDCPTFSLEGRSHKSLRQAVNRIQRAGYTTTFHDPSAIEPELRAQIEAMSEESRHGEAERGFSMTLSRLFQPEDTGLLLSVTRDPEGRVDAFCQWVPATAIGGWSLDVMRRRTDTEGLPNGLIDANIVATIARLADTGQRGLGLNFAMMREVLEGDPADASRIESLTRPILQRLSQGTQMGTLSTFNEKFDPGWVSRYVVLDSVELVATQALVLAGAEGVTEIPVIGRFLGNIGAAS